VERPIPIIPALGVALAECHSSSSYWAQLRPCIIGNRRATLHLDAGLAAVHHAKGFVSERDLNPYSRDLRICAVS